MPYFHDPMISSPGSFVHGISIGKNIEVAIPLSRDPPNPGSNPLPSVSPSTARLLLSHRGWGSEPRFITTEPVIQLPAYT